MLPRRKVELDDQPWRPRPGSSRVIVRGVRWSRTTCQRPPVYGRLELPLLRTHPAQKRRMRVMESRLLPVDFRIARERPRITGGPNARPITPTVRELVASPPMQRARGRAREEHGFGRNGRSVAAVPDAALHFAAPVQSSTFTQRPKIDAPVTHPLMRPRLFPIWNRPQSTAFTRCRYSA